MFVLSGKEPSEKILKEVKQEVDKLETKPKLVVILVGDNKASQVYVRNKEKNCDIVGINHETILLNENTSEYELINIIKKLNNDKETTGILLQLPLPKHIREKEVIGVISSIKDVDCFHPINVGNMFINKNNDILPCTPAGIIEMLKFYKINLEGKNALVIGRSNIVGKPIAKLLLDENCTVTIAHSKTKDLFQKTKNADIIISAIGVPKYIKREHIKDGTVIIDVGMNRDENNKLCGDVDFHNLEDISICSPVPGGVGLMTTAMLMKQTLTLYKLQHKLDC